LVSICYWLLPKSTKHVWLITPFTRVSNDIYIELRMMFRWLSK
jgi:hypothetical protein